MSRLSDDQRRAQMSVYYDFLKTASEQGDVYAQILQGLADPYPAYEAVRQLGPLVHSRVGAWVTADHQVANQVLRDRRFGVRKANGEKVPEFMSFDNSMLGLDPPEHTRLRRLTTKALNPRTADAWRPRAAEICDQLLDGILASNEPFDLMTAFAQQLPNTIIADLVGVPERYRPKFMRLSRRIAPLLDGVVSFHKARSVDLAIKELTAMFVEIIEQHAEEPRDGMINQLLPAVGQDLSMEELIPLCMFLPLAGTETTVNLIGNGTRALLEHPEQWDRLREDPGLAAGVAEETLRFDPPVQQYRRIAHDEIELAGQVLPVDAELAILAAGANRDPAVFTEPDRFDILRENGAGTLSFSSGIHYCLGAALARVEAEAAFRALATRMPGLRVAGAPRRRDSFIIRGMVSFPLAAK